MCQLICAFANDRDHVVKCKNKWKRRRRRKKDINELWMLKRLNKYKTCVHKLSANIYSDCRSFVFFWFVVFYNCHVFSLSLCKYVKQQHRLTMNNYNLWHVNRWWSCHSDGFFRFCIPLQNKSDFPFFSNSEFKSNLKLVFFLFLISGALLFPTKSFICFAVLDFYMIILRMEQKNTFRILIN